MTPDHSPSPTRLDRGPTTASLASLVAYPLLLSALLVAISYPLATAAVLFGGALAAAVARYVLSALADRAGDTARRVTVPGVGTVTVSFAPA